MSKCLLVLNRVDQKWIQIVLIIHICTSSTANTAVCRQNSGLELNFKGKNASRGKMLQEGNVS